MNNFYEAAKAQANALGDNETEHVDCDIFERCAVDTVRCRSICRREGFAALAAYRPAGVRQPRRVYQVGRCDHRSRLLQLLTGDDAMTADQIAFVLTLAGALLVLLAVWCSPDRSAKP